MKRIDSKAALPRRGFLHQLASLPLLGGGVALIGAPTAMAAAVTEDLLHAYSTWLHFERRMVCIELAQGNAEQARMLEGTTMLGNAGASFFFGDGSRWQTEQPFGRAALVLSAVGCDWREG